MERAIKTGTAYRRFEAFIEQVTAQTGSRYLPILADRANAFLVHTADSICFRPEGLRIAVQVTGIQLVTEDGMLLYEEREQLWLPFSSFRALVGTEGTKEAWVTGEWVRTDKKGTPVLGSLSAAMWLLDKGQDVPLPETSEGELLAMF